MANEIFDNLKSQISIVDVISRYVDLQKKGNNYVGLCPFHADKNPSMTVSESKKVFKCFSCGKGGDVFSFVAEKENISYKEACIKVCKDNNVELPEDFKQTVKKEYDNPYKYQYDIISKLTGFYMYSLNTIQGKEAKQYLIDRGLNDELIKYFKIGYAPNDSTLSISYLRQKEGYSIEQLDSTKILSSSTNEFKDRYTNRIIFPISNIYSKIVGFSGRKYAKDDISDAKYINSVDSQIFKKGDLLYNFDNAKKEIEQTKQVYVLEGFMDVIACYKAGIKNAVGLMGTSISSSHIKLFKNLGVEVRLLLDADEPGQIGISKAINQLYANNIKCVIVRPYTICKDTDELFKLKGAKGVQDALKDLISPTSYLIQRGLQAKKLITSSEKEDFIQNRIKIIYNSSNEIEKTSIINELSSKLNIEVLTIGKILNSKANNSYQKNIQQIQDNNGFEKKNTEKEENKIKPKVIIEGNKDKAIISQLITYLNTYFDTKILNNKLKISTINVINYIMANEINFLARSIIYKDFMINQKNLTLGFLIPSFNTVFLLITKCFENLTKEGLTSSLYYLQEENFSKIIQDYTVSCKQKDPDTNTNKFNDDDYKEVISILNILKNGKKTAIDDKENPKAYEDRVKKYSEYLNNLINKSRIFNNIE